jgi:hypothetical protein
MLFGTKIYPGEKPHYTPFPPSEDSQKVAKKKDTVPQLK